MGFEAELLRVSSRHRTNDQVSLRRTEMTSNAIGISGGHLSSIQPVSARNVNVRVDRGGMEVIDGLGEEWRRLCDESPTLEPFYRPEWVRASVRAFHPNADLLVLSAWTGTRLRGILPLIWQKGRGGRLSLRCLRFPD